jgi:hypothetical protein
MSVQFKHVRDFFDATKGGATFAVNVESVDFSKIQIDDVIDTMLIGMSVCSQKDCFDKKIGRDLAISRLKVVPLKVVQVSKVRHENGKLFSSIILDNDNFQLRFTQSSESSKFRLSSVVVTS